MLKYKLTIVDESERNLEGAKYPIKTYHEECVIGYFGSEEVLVRWATQSDGALAQSEYKE